MEKIPIVEYKGTQLFRDEEMIARKNVSQQEFENLLGVENAFKIINACNNGAEKSKKLHYQHPSFLSKQELQIEYLE